MSGVPATRIPIVDLHGYLAGVKAGRAAAAADICAALEGIGFFGIANHGVPKRVVQDAFAASQRFFGQPMADKLTVRINMGHRGYMPMADQHRADAAKPNLSESFLIGPELAADDPAVVEGRPLHGVNPWPDGLDGFRDALAGYRDAMSTLGLRLLPLFETALDLPEGFFAARYRNPMGSSGPCTIRRRRKMPTRSSMAPRRTAISDSSPSWRRTMSAACRSKPATATGSMRPTCPACSWSISATC